MRAELVLLLLLLLGLCLPLIATATIPPGFVLTRVHGNDTYYYEDANGAQLYEYGTAAHLINSSGVWYRNIEHRGWVKASNEYEGILDIGGDDSDDTVDPFKAPGAMDYTLSKTTPSDDSPLCLGVLSYDARSCCLKSDENCTAPVSLQCDGKVAPPCSMLTVHMLTVVYTTNANMGSSPLAFVKLMIAETNQVFLNSRIPVEFRLAKLLYLTDFDDTNDAYTMLTRFRLMDFPEANHAMLLTGYINSCGIAYVDCFQLPTARWCRRAVVRTSCALGYYTPSHELGHIFGLQHSAPHDGQSRFKDARGWVANPGYQEDGGIRDVMSYAQIDEKRLPIISNPEIVVNGYAMGKVDYANGARVLREVTGAQIRYYDVLAPTEVTNSPTTSAPLVCRRKCFKRKICPWPCKKPLRCRQVCTRE
jgi:hypothetical protein